MGLLESVLGSVLNGGQSSPQAPGHAPGAGALGGLGGLLGALASNPQLLQVIMGLLAGGQGRAAPAQDNPFGGLTDRFEQAGLGDVLGSWIGTGQNRPVSPDQLGQVFGQDRLSELGAQLGMGGRDFAAELSQVLPGLVDQLTPQGRLPQPGEGGGNEGLFGMLEAFGQQRR